MPFLWKSQPTLKYAPTPEIGKTFQQSLQVCRKHCESQINEHGNQILINLIDKKKNEKLLGEHFELLINSLKVQSESAL